MEDLFDADAFSSVAVEFGIVVLKDDDSSCNQNTPVINRGDRVMLALNTVPIFNEIPENVNIHGNIIPDEGVCSII
jgi:archaellin